MPIDLEMLARHRRYQDPAGFSEEFFQPRWDGGRTVAVVSRPSGEPKPVGWVFCHSFGIEQLHLEHLGVATARALAAAGFPVIRYHSRGYADSEVGMEAISLTSHIDDACAAVAHLTQHEGVERVGVMGPRFGGLVAALVAEQEDLPFMALWEPSTRGSQYMRDFLRTEVFAEMVGGAQSGANRAEQLRLQLEAQGWADIKGFRLARETYEQVSAVDLSRDLQRFRGEALVVSISRSPRPSTAVSKLVEHLTAIGARPTLRVMQDRFAPQFGQYRFATIEGGMGKRDIRAELDAAVAEATASWAIAQLETAKAAKEEHS